jgi:hypothetical protein
MAKPFGGGLPTRRYDQVKNAVLVNLAAFAGVLLQISMGHSGWTPSLLLSRAA